MTGPFYGCDNGGCSEECTYPAEYLRVYEGKLWCEGCWDNGQTIWLDGDGGDSGGNYLHYYDLDEFIPPEQQRIAELEADLQQHGRPFLSPQVSVRTLRKRTSGCVMR